MYLAATAVLVLGTLGCRSYASPSRYYVKLAGAQIPVELVASWLADAQDRRFDVEQVGPVYLSQHGFQNLRDGACDIACTDRLITASESSEMGDREVQGYRVAFYGYALYVHPDNPMDSIFAGHIGLVFQRKIADWKELGPYAGPIRTIGPQKNSRGGAILMRQARIWFDDPTWEALGSDAEIIERVAGDPQALGFAAIGFDRDVRYLGLRMQRIGPPAFPSLEEIESEEYGLAKVIYVYLPAEPSPAATAALDYLFSERGAEAIERTNVWPIARDRAAVAAKP